ncbi:MAG: hypothetical protein KDD67_01985 [Ignavibacteriae bacterium]|nr:hypothetical protein [Ignavibacteriota bacterium]MCB9215411.1 hypothetical protein [Ignavibacteria bacterium]
MQTRLHRSIVSLSILFLGSLFLVSCSEDVVGPDSYPVVLKPKSIKSISEIKTFVNEGGAWKEISTNNPEIANDPFFAESTVIQDDDGAYRIVSENEWQADEDATNTKFAYTFDGDQFVFSTLLPSIKVYAKGDYNSFNAENIALIARANDGSGSSVEFTIRGAYNPSADIFTQFELDPNSSTNDTVAYQTFQMVYVRNKTID